MDTSRRGAAALLTLALAGCALTPPAFEPPPELDADQAQEWRAGCDSGLHVASFGKLGVWTASSGRSWSRGYVTCRDRYVLIRLSR